MKEKINIATSRLQIRHLELPDLTDFHRYRSNPEVTRFQGFEPMTMQQAQAFIEENALCNFGTPGEWVQYAIAHLETGRLVGDCAIKLDAAEPSIAELGITISHHEQQKGYAKEALRGLLAFLFDARHLHRVVCITDARNVASVQMLKSAGFRQEGFFAENVFFKGNWESEYQYAMLRREWEAQKAV